MARLDSFLRWAEDPHVRLASAALVMLLAAHLAGGLRILALEFLAWRAGLKTTLALGTGLSLGVGLAYLLNVF